MSIGIPKRGIVIMPWLRTLERKSAISLSSTNIFLLRMIRDFDEECVSPYHLIHRLVIVDDDDEMDHELMLHSSLDVLNHCRDLSKEEKEN